MTAALNCCVSSWTSAGHLSGAHIAPLRRKALLPDDTLCYLDSIQCKRTYLHNSTLLLAPSRIADAVLTFLAFLTFRNLLIYRVLTLFITNKKNFRTVLFSFVSFATFCSAFSFGPHSTKRSTLLVRVLGEALADLGIFHWSLFAHCVIGQWSFSHVPFWPVPPKRKKSVVHRTPIIRGYSSLFEF
jgi:hypothetical protein